MNVLAFKVIETDAILRLETTQSQNSLQLINENNNEK